MASKKKTSTATPTTARAGAAGKKTSRKKTAGKKIAARKTAASKKKAAGTAATRKRKKTTARTAAAKTKKKSAKKASSSRLRIDELSSGAQRLMLANLGLYGKVLDELQNQLSRAKSTVQKARKDPDAANRQLVARGEKLLAQVKDLLKESGAPATRQLNEQIADLRDALGKLRKKVSKG